MQNAGFDQNLDLPSGGSKFVKLTKKGEKITFRLAATPKYHTRHWIEKKPILCDKYASEDKKAPCAYCEQLARFVDKKDEGSKQKVKELSPVTTFYYPILNLDTDKPAVFQFTAKSIHFTIKRYADQGVDVFDTNWLVERTEEQGNYYPVLNLGGKPLSEEQKEALEVAKNINLDASESSSVSIGNDEKDSKKDTTAKKAVSA